MAGIADVIARFRAVLTACGTAGTRLRGADEAFQTCVEALAQALEGARDRDSIALMGAALDSVRAANDAVEDAIAGRPAVCEPAQPGCGRPCVGHDHDGDRLAAATSQAR
ncbi:hypothetical protein ACFFS4_01315 [Kutzneria kofuensis]|uniref:hypothetical protein n=1 Tax=Kutzneria kofuensis TaxID=103725 RepID=UPI001FE29395|nr:hypothetical protein [Kutzneria kofuensis]